MVCMHALIDQICDIIFTHITNTAIISKWNKSFRGWSENYIKPYKSAILRACLFRDRELQKGHSSALKDIEKNKGDIRSFVMENTEQKYSSLLPSKILQDSYSFNHDEYRMVYRSCLNNFICWKPGTSNALSKSPLEIVYGSNSNNEHFKCKFRKYQLESMKKFIQATPGTKEIRGQWSVNLADDSMMITFGQQQDIVIIIKIGCFKDKLQIMYQENGILRKNSKIRKQTLKTSCWGLEKTKNSPKFENSIIIQENYSIDINADNVLSISPIKVYVKKTALTLNRLKIFCGDVCQVINLQKRPYHIQSIQYPQLTHDDEQHLRLKYRNNLLNHSKTKSGTTVSKPTPIKSEPTSSSTSTRSSRPRSSRPQSSRSSNNAPPAVTIDDDGDQDVDAQGWNPTKPKRNHSQQIIDDDTVNDDDNNDEDDDHGFNPTKPNPQQYRNRIQSSLNRINRIIPSGAISIASLEDTVVTTTNQVGFIYISLHSFFL